MDFQAMVIGNDMGSLWEGSEASTGTDHTLIKTVNG
jgi:hypothetical protein